VHCEKSATQIKIAEDSPPSKKFPEWQTQQHQHQQAESAAASAVAAVAAAADVAVVVAAPVALAPTRRSGSPVRAVQAAEGAVLFFLA
jgi:hypothetical protein